MRARPNLLAVLVAAIAHFALGAAWFTLFANLWIAGVRMSPAEVAAARLHPSPLPYVLSLVCSVVIAYDIAWVLTRLDERNVRRGIGVGAVIGLVAAAAMLTELAFEQRTSSFCWIAAGYPLVGSIVMGIVIGAWPERRT